VPNRIRAAPRSGSQHAKRLMGFSPGHMVRTSVR
jgi:hypothetical protein